MFHQDFQEHLTDAVLQRFATSRPLSFIEAPGYHNFSRMLQVYYLTDFKGYQ